MAANILVDGYNLARSGLVPLEQDPLSEAGRQELCGLLASYAVRKGFRLIVVFDGRGTGRGDRSRTAFKGGTALYSSAFESADDVIREMAQNSPIGTIVVTSDRGLIGTLPSRTVTVVTCGEFADRLFAFQLEAIKIEGEGHRQKKKERKLQSYLRKL